ncbi:Ig-like domain-containing protein [Bacillus alkalicellulosilyticus]|uniref:Ig-like domain-containing protein n=1 Tax=Alkalihalobacterium alkalicellulosilyticum TaxID=1912214 RepID=UPI0009974F21|nr:Ig-like domain-containing protein [Bacillus alkalicellulosilyticus]
MNKLFLHVFIILLLSLFASMTIYAEDTYTVGSVQSEQTEISSTIEGEKYVQQFTQQLVAPDQTWTISFTSGINGDSITDESLYIVDSKGLKVETLVIFDGNNNVTILPPRDGYQPLEKYQIFIKDIRSARGEKLAKNYQLSFTIQSNYEGIQAPANTSNQGWLIGFSGEFIEGLQPETEFETEPDFSFDTSSQDYSPTPQEEQIVSNLSFESDADAKTEPMPILYRLRSIFLF